MPVVFKTRKMNQSEKTKPEESDFANIPVPILDIESGKPDSVQKDGDVPKHLNLVKDNNQCVKEMLISNAHQLDKSECCSSDKVDESDLSQDKTSVYTCKICKQSFGDKSGLKHHLPKHYKVFRCATCNKAFRYKSLLLQHLPAHSKVKRFKCHLCSKGFIHKSSLCKHLKIHVGINMQKCDACKKNFLFRSHLLRHMKTHLHLKNVLAEQV